MSVSASCLTSVSETHCIRTMC